MMNRFLKLLSLILITAAGTLPVLAQTGPGGVGNNTGADGQPNNVIWLDANSLGLTDGDDINSWTEKSNSFVFGQSTFATATVPIFRDNALNGLPYAEFSRNLNALVLNPFNSMPSSTITTFIMMRTTGNTDATISYATGSANNEYLLFRSDDVDVYVNNTQSGVDNTGVALNSGNWLAFTHRWQNTGATQLFVDGDQEFSTSSATTGTNDNGGSLALGGEQDAVDGGYDANQDFVGDMAEVIIFDAYLNDAQVLLVNNYLSSKYNVALATSGNDLYAGDNALNDEYDFDVAGVTQVSGATHTSASSAGFLIEANSTLDTNGEAIMAGHKNNANAVSADSLGASVQGRWARSWYVDVTTAGTLEAELGFDFSDGIGGQFPQGLTNYVLLRRNGATYDVVTVADANKRVNGDQIYFTVSSAAELIDGYYTLGTLSSSDSPLIGGGARTWYSYIDGNYSSSGSWTLDGGQTPIFNNPSNETPDVADNVVITTGRTITVDVNNINADDLEVIGTLDIGTSSGANFSTISGTGRIRIAGSSGTDNFPAGDASLFSSVNNGGTLEIYGTGITLGIARSFKDVELNMTAGTDIASLESDWTVSNNLTINNGTLRFGNNSATTARNLTVNGDITVNGSGSNDGRIAVGTGNTGTAVNDAHNLDFYGNLTNNGGDVRFTNRTSVTVGSVSSTGRVNVNALEASADQSITCDGITYFSRIEINKGTDDTYVLNIDASDAANFGLFGAATEGHGETEQLTDNINSLGLIYGTVRIGTNVTVEQLNTGSNYNVSEGARLWVDGGAVSKTSGTAIVPYGRILVSAGTLTSNVSSGITLRSNGTIEVTGGTLSVYQIRTSVLGVGNEGGYVQSGGEVFVTAVSTNTSYYPFNLTFPGNSFNMSGGELTINRANSKGGFFVNSSAANVSVTGGTIIFETNNTTDFKVLSTASLWNLTIRNSSGGSPEAFIDAESSMPDVGAVSAQPLVVQNDLIIESNAQLDARGNGMEIGGDFTVNGTFQSNSNTITIFGVQDSQFFFDNGTVDLFNLVLAKDANDDILRTASASGTPAYRITNDLTVTTGTLNFGTFNTTIQGNLHNSAAIGTSGQTGTLTFDGAAAQSITSSSGTFENITIDNTNGVTLVDGPMTVNGTLTLTNGLFSIDDEQLVLGTDATIAGTGFSNTKMIQTAGNFSDPGLVLPLSLTGSYTNETVLSFPIGSGSNYTPARVVINGSPGTVSGTVTINGVNSAHPNLQSGKSSVPYYWRVRSSSGLTSATTSTVKFEFDWPTNITNGWSDAYLEDGQTTWVYNVNTLTDSPTLEFDGVGFIDGDFTVGEDNATFSEPRILYARKNGAWHDPTTWSLSEGGAALTLVSELPTAGDVVIVGTTSTNYAVAVWDDHPNYAPIEIARLVILRYGSGESSLVSFDAGAGDHNLGIVTNQDPNSVSSTTDQASKIIIAGPTLPAGDFGEFVTAPNTVWTYSRRFPGSFANTGISDEQVSSFTMGNTVTEYPVLQFEYSADNSGFIEFPDVDITVNGDIRMFKENQELRLNSSATGGDVTVGGDIQFNTGGVNYSVIFPAGNNARTLTVQGDIDFLGESGGYYVENAAGTAEHRIRLQGNVVSPTNDSEFILYRVAGQPVVNFEFYGTGNSSWTSMNTNPVLNQLIINKGTDISTTVTLNEDIGLNATTNGSTKALEMQSGTLILNNGSLNIPLTTGGDDFILPSGTGIEVTNGTLSVSGDDTGIALEGTLRVNGGTVDLDDAVGNGNNYIEYGTSGSATIEVSSGTLTVGSQIRRSTSTTTGVLSYTQTGGTVVLGKNTAPETNRGVLEVLNTGSNFTHTGGDLTIVRQSGSTATNATLILDPATSDLTGSTITFGNADTPASQTTMGINSTVALNNLTITNNNSLQANLSVRALTVNGTLTVDAGAQLNSNDLDLTLGGNFVNNGTYAAGTNTTTFSGTGAQEFSGSGTSTFNNLTKSGAGTLTMSKDLSVTGNLAINAGTMATGTQTLDLDGNATIIGTHTATGGSGILFSGSVKQQLTRSGGGTGTSTLGIITINNANGVEVPDGTGFNFTITNNLRLESGQFDIGGSLLTMASGATIEAVNAFSVDNMVRTNSSFTDSGLRREFGAISSSTDLVFPVGEVGYTPVTFTITNSSAGSLTVRPANEIHPSVVEDSEAPDTEITDTSNALEYYWTITGSGLTSFTGSAVATYAATDLLVTAPYTAANYIPVRLFENDANWDKAFDEADFDENNNLITYGFSNAADATITGDYTAGVGEDNLGNPINGSIPDQVPTYETAGTGGNYDDASAWATAIPTGGPVGAIITVNAGDELTLNTDNTRIYQTVINGTLTIDGTIGHRLGTVTGTGTLRITSNTNTITIPAGFYDDFLACSGGTLEYGGTGSYTILNGISQLRGLNITGSGTKTMSSSDITICEDMTISGGDVVNSSNVNITVEGNLVLSGGSFADNTGTTVIEGNMTVSGGSFDGGAGGTTTIQGNLNVTSGTFSVGSLGSVILQGDLSYSSGTFTGGSGGAFLVMQGAAAQQITGNFTGANQLYRLTLDNPNNVTMNGDIDIDSRLTFTQGRIITGGNTLTLDGDATASPASGTSTSFVDGALSKVITSSGSSFEFPIGKGTRQANALIFKPNTGGLTWTAEYFNEDPMNNATVTSTESSDPFVTKVSGLEYWVISDGNAAPSGVTAQVGLSWAADSDVSTDQSEREQLEVLAWNTTNSNWDNFGGGNFSSGNDATGGSFISAGTLSFSENIVTLGTTDEGNNLPVRLAFFKAAPGVGKVGLTWETYSELNNDRFEVQHSSNGKEWAQIGQVNGAGTHWGKLNYAFTHQNAPNGINYYRLKQVDFDGTFEYSPVATANVLGLGAQGRISVYPNPTAQSNITVQLLALQGNPDVPVLIMVNDMLGKQYYKEAVSYSNAQQGLSVVPQKVMEPGVYIVTVKYQGQYFQERLVISQ